MNKYIGCLLLSFIVVIGIITRFYKLGEVPKGFYVDEAGQGYSAYSILKTGKDEFGKSFPVIFRSLSDFKTPVYTYFIIPFISIFGLNTYSVRLPSAVFGVLTVIVFYFLIKEITGNRYLSAISSLLLAISPWHILFSRTDFECVVSLAFFLAGVLFFYKSLKKPPLIIFSGVLMAVSLQAYQAERIIVPIITFLLFYKHNKILLGKSHRKYLFIAVILGLIFTLPTLSIITTPGFSVRAAGLNIFSHNRQMPDGYLTNYNGVFSAIINSSWFLTAREFFSLYFSYFSPRYMFNLGDYGLRSSFPELSTFFLWEFPFYLYGLWKLIKTKGQKELRFLIISLLIISPIPAALTRDPYTTIRALPLVVPQIIIIGIGITESYKLIKLKYQRLLFLSIFFVLIIYSLLKLYSSIFILNEYYRAKAWDWGWQDVTNEIVKLNTNLPIIVDNARSDAYPQLAFFLKYDPIKFMSENYEVPLTEYYTNLYHNPEKHIGNIITRPINWEKDLMTNQYLIGDELGISIEQIEIHKLSLIKQINYPDGSPAYRIVRTNPDFEITPRRIYNIPK